MSEESDRVIDVVRELRECGRSWEPTARLLGNVRAADIVRVCDAVLLAADALRMGTAKPEKPARGPIIGWRVSAHYRWPGNRDGGREYARKGAIDYATKERKDAEVFTDRDDAAARAREWKTYGGWSRVRLHPVRTRPTRRGGAEL